MIKKILFTGSVCIIAVAALGMFTDLFSEVSKLEPQFLKHLHESPTKECFHCWDLTK